MRLLAHMRLRLLLSAILTLALSACSASSPLPPADSAEATLEVPAAKVRSTVIEVLTANGYPVEAREDSQILTTGYRQEVHGPWDWLLRWRVGVGRSLVVATVTPEDEVMTRVTIQVTYEAKNRLWDSWTEDSPPLPFTADNGIRQIKNALGLL